MKNPTKKLENEVAELKRELDEIKKGEQWKKSKIRKILIGILIYASMTIFMISIQFEQPFTGAIVPTIAYFIAMAILSIFKGWKINQVNKKGFIQLSLLISMVISFPFASTIFIKQHTSNQIHSTIETLPQMESALILGAAAYGNRLSTVLMHRMDAGIEIYKNKKVKNIIVSGAPNETKAMKAYAIKNGIPENNIIEDSKGLSTFASTNNFKDHPSIIFVTQAFHLPRTIYMANRLNLEAAGYIADRGNYTKISHFKKRELIANSYAIIVTSGGKRK